MTAHVCPNNAWPTGHPLPVENPAKLEGPEIGTAMILRGRGLIIDGVREPDTFEVVRVIERSYVWSPGECRSNGGYRHYDWSVIERGPDRYRVVVVNDTDLSPLPEGERIRVVYTNQRSVAAR